MEGRQRVPEGVVGGPAGEVIVGPVEVHAGRGVGRRRAVPGQLVTCSLVPHGCPLLLLLLLLLLLRLLLMLVALRPHLASLSLLIHGRRCCRCCCCCLCAAAAAAASPPPTGATGAPTGYHRGLRLNHPVPGTLESRALNAKCWLRSHYSLHLSNTCGSCADVTGGLGRQASHTHHVDPASAPPLRPLTTPASPSTTRATHPYKHHYTLGQLSMALRYQRRRRWRRRRRGGGDAGGGRRSGRRAEHLPTY